MAESLAPPRIFDSAPRFMRLVAWGVGALAAVVIVLSVVPALLDWSRYRGTIARFAASELGRPVRIDGRISVVLLPSPLVVASDVRLGDRGDGIALAAPELRLRLALVPLLFGHVVPRELVLSKAAITLPWPLPPAALASDRPAWLGASSARIEGGTLIIGAMKLTDLEAGLAAGGVDTGGLVVTGSGRAFGQSWHFMNRLGVSDTAGAAPFEVWLDGVTQANAPPLDMGGHFIGTLAQDGALTGRLTAHAADLSRLMPAPPVAAHAEGMIGLGSGPGQAELALDIGGVPITAELRPGPAGDSRVLSLSAGQLDLDGWTSALTRLRVGGSTSQMIHLPWPVSLDLSADAVQVRGGLIRGLHAALDVDGSIARLRDATAVLPGEALVKLKGTLTEDVAGLSLSGDATLDAPQLRDTLTWLKGTGLKLGDGMPSLVLRNAKLAGHVMARRDRVELTSITGAIERSRVTGSAGVDTASGAIDADLSADQLSLDNWLPGEGGVQWDTVSNGLANFDVALKLHARTVVLRGVAFANVALDAATSAGGLAVNSLDFSLDGLNGTISGTMAADGELSDGQFDLSAPQATALAHYLTQHVPWLHFTDYLWSGPIHLHAEANGPRSALLCSLGLDLADARLEAHPVIDFTHQSWTAQLTLRHPGAPRLLGALGVARAREWLGEGSLSMLAQLSGSPGQVRLDSFDLTAGLMHVSGDLALARGKEPVVAGHVMADTLPFPMFAPHSGAPIPLALLQGWSAKVALSAADVTVGDTDLVQNASAVANLAAGTLKLDDIKAQLGGGALAGSAAIETAAEPPHVTVSARLVGAKLQNGLFGTPLDLGGGVFDVDFALAAEGHSFAAMTASLDGVLHLVGASGNVTGIDVAAAHEALMAAKSVMPSLAAGVTPFDHLAMDGAVKLGMLTIGHGELTGPAGATQAAGTIDASAGTMSLLAHLPDQLDLRLSGPFGAPRRLVEPGPVASAP